MAEEKNTKTKLSGTKVAVLGFGIENQETVEFLLKHGSQVTVFDEKEESTFDSDQIKHLRENGVRFQFGSFGSLAEFGLIVRSPGVKPGIKALHEVGDLGIEITSATNLFFEYAKGITIGITGTKGKGTAAALLYEIIKASGKDVYLGGNIGIPALSFVDKLADSSISILELSSFQLMDVDTSPHIAVVLMVTQDHLDYHTSTEEYAFAKMGITRFQTANDFVIVNKDYAASLQIAERSEGQKFLISRHGDVEQGCFVYNDWIYIAKDGVKEKIIPTSDVLVPGKHNLENVCAAIMAARLLNLKNKTILETIGSFRGLEHRLELVREVSGVRYYNDSIATTPDSAIAAIRAFDGPKILIMGGSSKGSDFTELGKVITESGSIKAIIGIGKEWPSIKSQITNHKLQLFEGLTTMSEIVEKCSQVAKSGDVVILSPACASFDMFRDYKDRGKQFIKHVNQL